MKKSELIDKAQNIIRRHGTGVFATTDRNGEALLRWMTPVLVNEYPDSIFTISSFSFADKLPKRESPFARWMLQTPMLDEIIHFKGYIDLLMNPSIKRDILEAGFHNNMNVNWKIDFDFSDTVVVEMKIITGSIYNTHADTKNRIIFDHSQYKKTNELL